MNEYVLWFVGGLLTGAVVGVVGFIMGMEYGRKILKQRSADLAGAAPGPVRIVPPQGGSGTAPPSFQQRPALPRGGSGTTRW